jgi:hypothetical protein
MTERAAHLVDAVLPWVPVRQWVLTVPYRLRYPMAWNHGLSRAVLRVHSRVLLDLYAGGARAHGLERGQTGMVTAVQRAGSGLNVNLHFHTLVLDGVPVPEPTASTVPLAAGPEGSGVKTASPRAGSWAALMHRAFGIDVLACAQCGGRLRLIATLHDPAVIRRILVHLAPAHSGPSPGPAHPNPAPPRPDRISSGRAGRRRAGATRWPSCCPVGRPIDGSSVSNLACRSPEPARSIWEEAADVYCGNGLLGRPVSESGRYVAGTGTRRGATAAEGCLVLAILPRSERRHSVPHDRRA